MHDKGAEPQTIGIAADATRPQGPPLKMMADQLQAGIEHAPATLRTPRPA